MSKIFIIGQIEGIEDENNEQTYNVYEFNRVEEILKGMGHEVVNIHHIDRTGISNYAEANRQDIFHLMDFSVQEAFVMDDFSESHKALTEVTLCQDIGIPMVCFPEENESELIKFPYYIERLIKRI